MRRVIEQAQTSKVLWKEANQTHSANPPLPFGYLKNSMRNVESVAGNIRPVAFAICREGPGQIGKRPQGLPAVQCRLHRAGPQFHRCFQLETQLGKYNR